MSALTSQVRGARPSEMMEHHDASDRPPIPAHRDRLEALRGQFPWPSANSSYDGAFADAVQQTLARVAALKNRTPILGSPVESDFAAALQARMDEAPQTLDQTIDGLLRLLEGTRLPGHSTNQFNVAPPPSIASILGVLLAATCNPNLCSEESGRGFSFAETAVAAMAARLVGYDPVSAAGVFTFGGTGCTLYAVKVGLEKAQPGNSAAGVRPGAVVLASRACHYSAQSAAAWLGIGQDRVLLAPCHEDGAVRIDALAQAARAVLLEGRQIAAIIATLGSTDAFALDGLAEIHVLREDLVREFSLRYRPHLHADSVAGWPWAAFNDYDFERNELAFSEQTRRALAAACERVGRLPLADSLGVDFHKTGFAPYISSLVLFRDRRDLDLIRRPPDATPYLYQSPGDHPGMFTLETSRSGAGPMAALASLLALGKQGLRTLLGHAVEMAGVLRQDIISRSDLALLNGRNVGSVTLFRVYPPGVDAAAQVCRELSEAADLHQTQAHNALNRRVYERLRAEALAGRGVLLSMSEYASATGRGSPLAALKSYVLSPFCDEDAMHSIVPAVLAARDAVFEKD